jgi:hypothetical protein
MNSDAASAGRSRWTDGSMEQLVRKRYAAERRFRLFGLLAVGLSVAFLAFLLVTMAAKGLGGFTHIIAGSVETMCLVATGAASWQQYVGGYMIPVLLGNVIGGVALVAALNHAQVVSK